MSLPPRPLRFAPAGVFTGVVGVNPVIGQDRQSLCHTKSLFLKVFLNFPYKNNIVRLAFQVNRRLEWWWHPNRSGGTAENLQCSKHL